MDIKTKIARFSERRTVYKYRRLIYRLLGIVTHGANKIQTNSILQTAMNYHTEIEKALNIQDFYKSC